MADEQRLSELLVELAHTRVTGFPVQDILDHLTQRILEVLPVDGAGVMLMGQDDEMFFVSASDQVLMQVEGLQIELGEGPCLEAYRSGARVLVPDLSADVRFPRFGPRAVEAGLGAVYSFPMRLDGGRLGAADLYRQQPGELAAEDASIGQVLADVAAAYIVNARGRAASEQAEHELRYQALHDPLTKLPNRTLLYDRISHALARGARDHHVPAVLFIDLDRFKEVNDNFGHQAGDELLVAVAQRLNDTLRESDTLARMSGDEFVILCDELDSAGHAATLAERIAESFRSPFGLPSGDDFTITASIGVAFASQDLDTPEALLRAADAAMYEAKALGGDRFQTRAHAAR